MSKLGKTPVAIPDKVKVSVAGGMVKVEGPGGNESLKVPAQIDVKIADKVIQVSRKSDEKFVRALHGTTRAHLANMVKGVTQGFDRTLEISGVGYNAQMQGKTLKMTLGFSHPIELPVPEGLTVTCTSPTQIVVKGSNRQKVGHYAAKVRSARPVEPYNLKGVKYRDEVVKKKAGKTFVTGAS